MHIHSPKIKRVGLVSLPTQPPVSEIQTDTSGHGAALHITAAPLTAVHHDPLPTRPCSHLWYVPHFIHFFMSAGVLIPWYFLFSAACFYECPLFSLCVGLIQEKRQKKMF